MATRTATKAAPRDFAAEVAFLTRALKAPTLRESVTRLAERARTESWSHEEFLVACLQREVSARESHGGAGPHRAARFRAVCDRVVYNGEQGGALVGPTAS